MKPVQTFSIFTISLLLTSSVLAGSSIWGHRHKTSNPNGIHSIGIYICGSLSCPKVVIKNGPCDGIENASMQYGVCLCNDGYQVQDGICVEESYVCTSELVQITNCDGSLTECCPDDGNVCEDPECDCPANCICDLDGTITAKGGYYLLDDICVICPEAPACPLDDECCTLTGPEDVCGRPTIENGFLDFDGKCYPCNYNDETVSDDTSCNNCSQREWFGGHCYPNKCDGFWDDDNNCHPCDDENSYLATSCYKCPNRTIDFRGHCILKTPSCPEGTGEDATLFTGGAFIVTENGQSITCYCATGEEHNGTTCVTACATSGSCSSNEGLCPGYYCSIGAGTIPNDMWCGSSAQYIAGAGSIQPLGEVIEGPSYLVSSAPMASWDAAVNYCSALKTAINTGVAGYENLSLSYGRLPSYPQSGECQFKPGPAGDCSEGVSAYSMLDMSGKKYWLNDLCQPGCAGTTDEGICLSSNSSKSVIAASLRANTSIMKFSVADDREDSGNYVLCE